MMVANMMATTARSLRGISSRFGYSSGPAPQALVRKRCDKRPCQRFHAIGNAYYSSLAPIVIESTPQGERAYDIYSRLLKDRIVCITGGIYDEVASAVMAQLLFLEAEDPTKPISIYINSPGGVVTAGLAIYDTMQYLKPDIATVCVGQAASMGSLLLSAGTPGMRTSLPNSRIMVHQPSGGASGQASDIQIQAEEIMKLKRQLNEIYVAHTGQTYEAVEAALDRDKFMSPHQALEFGIIDKVVTRHADESSVTSDSEKDQSSEGSTTEKEEESKKEE